MSFVLMGLQSGLRGKRCPCTDGSLIFFKVGFAVSETGVPNIFNRSRENAFIGLANLDG
jgi:hypothetical protein